MLVGLVMDLLLLLRHLSGQEIGIAQVATLIILLQDSNAFAAQ
jgi:hypothetical protein